MYDLRSKIIHGNYYEIKLEEVNKLEEILRKSINLGIKDKSILSDKKFKEILF